MSRLRKIFTPVDIGFFLDPKVQIMIRKLGHDAVTAYLCMLDQMYYYKDYHYAIPEACYGTIAGILQMTELRLREIIVYLIGIEFLSVETDDEGAAYVYSPRRRAQLMDMEETNEKRRISGIYGAEVKYGKEYRND